MNNVASVDVDILKSVIDASCDAFEQAVVVYDRNDTIIFASKQILRFFPVAAEDLLPGTAMRHLLGAVFDSTQRYHESKKRVAREDWIANRLAIQWNERFDSVARYGADRWLEAKGGRSANGVGITILQDVSESVRRERKWQSDLERMASTEALLDEMPFPLFVKDQDLTFIGVNRAFCKLYDVHPEDVLGRTVWDITDGALAACLEASNRKVIETGEPSNIFEEKKTPSGEMRKFLRREFRIGPPENYLLVTMIDDLTTTLEGQMENEKIAIGGNRQEAGPAEENMVAVAADIAPEENRLEASGGVRVLVVSADTAFTNPCTDMLRSYGFDTCAVVSCHEAEVFLAEAERLSFMPDIVLVDDRLDKARLADAVGRATVIMPVNAGRPVHFLVGDILANVSKPAGANIAEASDEDPIFAPAGLPCFDGPDETPIYRYSDVEVLVVEDNAVNQEVFSSILQGLSIEFRLAVCGEDALAMFEELRPKLVFLDVTLPGIDACEVARGIAAMDSGRPIKTPVVGVLPREDADAEAACLRSGMAGCIVKPVSTEALELVYERYVRKAEKSAAARKNGGR